MINPKSNPVEWAALMYELDDAKEHLEALINQMVEDGIDETDYQIQLGHIFAHLNRSWNSRNKIGEYNEQERKLFTKFPESIEPCG